MHGATGLSSISIQQEAKGSHGTVYVEGRSTQVQHGEIATGTLMSMFRELGIDRRNF